MEIGDRLLLLFVVAALSLVPSGAVQAQSDKSEEQWFLALDSALEGWDAARLHELSAQAPGEPERDLASGLIAFVKGEFSRAATLASKLQTGSTLLLERADRLEDLASAWDATFKKLEERSLGDGQVSVWFPTSHAVWVGSISGLLLRSDRVYRTLLSSGDAPLRLVFLGDRRSLSRVTRISERSLAASGTLAVTVFRTLFVLSPSAFPDGYPWFRVLSHELVHFHLRSRGLTRFPVFLEEGLAMGLEEWSLTGKFRGITTYERGLMHLALEHGLVPTPMELVAPFWQMEDTLRIRVAFLLSMLWVRELLERGGEGALARWLEGCTEQGWEPATRSLTGWSATRLQTRARSRFKSEARREASIRVTVLESESWLRPREAKLLEEARQSVLLADLLWGKGHEKAALRLLQSLPDWIARTPDVLWRQLELLRVRGQQTEAEPLLAEALEWYPEDSRILLLAARMAQDRGDREETSSFAFRAYMVNPFALEIDRMARESGALEKMVPGEAP